MEMFHLLSLLFIYNFRVINASSTECLIDDVVSAKLECESGAINLIGAFLNVGMHNSGSFGSSSSAPVSVSEGTSLGVVADFDKNGFHVASSCDTVPDWYYYADGYLEVCPTCSGDFITPGAPLEGQ
jgi:hypothetical protein